MRDKKYKYLRQLVITSIVMVIIPVLLFYNLFWGKSYNEIKRLNTENHTNSLDFFYGAFLREASEFKMQVAMFGSESRSSQLDGGIFFQGTAKMKEFAYYYGEAIDEITTFGQEMNRDGVGIYYYDQDLVLGKRGKFSSIEYIERALEVSEDNSVELGEFFSEDQYAMSRMIISPIKDENGISETFLLGICTVLGKDKEKAIVFCEINEKNMELSYLSEQEKYYIIDNNTKSVLFSMSADQNDYEWILDRYDFNNKQKEQEDCYFKEYETMNLTFAVDVSGDEVQQNLTKFYVEMRMFFAYITVLMAIISVLMVYVNYKPMYSLLRKIKYKGKNEFEEILNIWEGQNRRLEEQKYMIIHLLMQHLLYGVPISKHHINSLGVSESVTKYNVFVVENYVLKVHEVDEITAFVEENFEALLYATDMTGENSMVIILFMKQDNAEKIFEWMEIWSKKNIKEKIVLKRGISVNTMDEIRKSWESCKKESSNLIDSKSVSEMVRKRTEANEKLREEIIEYLDKHFTDNALSQQMLADYFNITVYTLSRVFNNQIGTGFSEYINSKRVEYAKELLKTTEIPVKQIATIVGISNENYFSKIFKKYTGYSPVEFREE